MRAGLQWPVQRSICARQRPPCSAASLRRERPRRASAQAEFGTAHSTSKVWHAPDRACRRCGSRHRQAARACSHSCSSVLASLLQLSSSGLISMILEQAVHLGSAAGRSRRRRRWRRSRLDRVGQDRRAARPPRGFALGQAQHLGQARPAQLVQAVLADQVGAPAGQVAFRRAGNARTAGRRPPGSAPRRRGIPAARCGRRRSCGGVSARAAARSGKACPGGLLGIRGSAWLMAWHAHLVALRGDQQETGRWISLVGKRDDDLVVSLVT